MFLTGEFSRIARISKRMLQHYDRVGLFSPEHTDPQTGYRYYSARQLPRLNRILALKDLGLTLEQVRTMIDEEVTVLAIRGMLLLQKVELEQQLRESLERIQRVEARLERLSDSVTEHRVEVVVKSAPALRYLSTRRIFADVQEGQVLMAQLLNGLPARLGRHALGPLMSVMHSPVFEIDHSDSEIGFVLQHEVAGPVSLGDDLTLTVRELPPAAAMATAVDGRHALLRQNGRQYLVADGPGR